MHRDAPRWLGTGWGCALPGTEGRDVMFQTHGNIVEVTIVSGHAERDAQLAQLAQIAAS